MSSAGARLDREEPLPHGRSERVAERPLERGLRLAPRRTGSRDQRDCLLVEQRGVEHAGAVEVGGVPEDVDAAQPRVASGGGLDELAAQRPGDGVVEVDLLQRIRAGQVDAAAFDVIEPVAGVVEAGGVDAVLGEQFHRPWRCGLRRPSGRWRGPRRSRGAGGRGRVAWSRNCRSSWRPSLIGAVSGSGNDRGPAVRRALRGGCQAVACSGWVSSMVGTGSFTGGMPACSAAMSICASR
jgi:hypothetical protein